MSNEAFPFVLTPDESGIILWLSQWHAGIRVIPIGVILVFLVATAIVVPASAPINSGGLRRANLSILAAGLAAMIVLAASVVLQASPLLCVVIFTLSAMLLLGGIIRYIRFRHYHRY